ncbi:MAG: hypothetical protein FJ271_02205 [Planctomycetes bacterium]|nr:hypothetical protein [Planctomycetota bacterium]
MLHRAGIDRYPDTLAALAVELGDLRYDAFVSFLHALAAKLETDGQADAGRGRPRLAAALADAAAGIRTAAAEMERAWFLCAPHMPASSADHAGNESATGA